MPFLTYSLDFKDRRHEERRPPSLLARLGGVNPSARRKSEKPISFSASHWFFNGNPARKVAKKALPGNTDSLAHRHISLTTGSPPG